MLKYVALLALVAAATAAETYQCHHPSRSVCRLENIRTTISQPNFKIESPNRHDVLTVSISNSSLPILTSDICDYFPQVRFIIAERVGIQHITDNAIYSCAALVDISLADNKLQLIQSRVFQNHPVIELVDLTNNDIKVIADDQFTNNRNLRYIKANLNAFSEFPASAIDKSANIREIQLHNNNLFDLDIEGILDEAPRLYSINFNFNIIPCGRVEKIQAQLKRAQVAVGTMGIPQNRVFRLGLRNGVVCVDDEPNCNIRV